MKSLIVTGILAILLVTLYGCYPGGPEYNSDYSVVVTDYDTEFDFGNKKTYFMPDTISFSTNDGSITEEQIAKFEGVIIDQIASNMRSLGYTRVDETATETPDLFIGTHVLAVENTGAAWVPGWGWGGWGGWYGWYYPPYYPVSYSYSTGTVLILMGDPNADPIIEDGTVSLPIVWAAGLDGLLSSYASNNVTAVQRGIDQAFMQSTYLKSNL